MLKIDRVDLGGGNLLVAVLDQALFVGWVFELLGKDRSHVDRPTRLDALRQQPVERMQQGEIALNRRLVDPVGSMWALAVTQHIGHVCVEAKQKATNGHGISLAGKQRSREAEEAEEVREVRA